MAEEGAHVVLCARGADDLDAAVRAVSGPGRAVGVVADVTSAEGATAVVGAAVDQLGGLDIVVNNVGGSGARTFDDMDADDLQTVLGQESVPRSQRLACRGARVARAWRRRDRDDRVDLGAGGWRSPSYNVAKAAEISLAKAMAGDLARDGIRVFSVAPGSTLFPGGSWERRLRDDPEGMAAFIERELPWGRLGTVDEVADVVTFLVSPRASWVVGTCVAVDGGQSRSF